MTARCARTVAAMAALALASPVTGAILDTGVDTEGTPLVESVQTLANGACRIAWYRAGSTDDELDRLEALGYDIDLIGKAAINLDNLLANYDLLVLAFTGPGLLAAQQPAIQAFADLGHGVWIHQPNHAGTLDYCPVNFGVTVSDPAWCAPEEYFATIEEPTHPITSGLSDTDLSGAFDTVTLGAGWSVLATNVTCGDPALAVGTTGIGRVLFDTGNAAPLSLVPGSEAYWDAMFEWICSIGPIAIDHASWGAVKASYR